MKAHKNIPFFRKCIGGIKGVRMFTRRIMVRFFNIFYVKKDIESRLGRP